MSKSVLMFSSGCFLVSSLPFRSLIHFELILVYGVRECSNFILLHVAVQFSQHRYWRDCIFSVISSCFLHRRSLLLCVVAQSCLTLCDTMDCSLPGTSVHGDSPGKNSGVGCHALLQGIFLTQRWNLHLLHWQADSLPLSHLGSPWKSQNRRKSKKC